MRLPPDPDRRRRPPDREQNDSDLAAVTRVDPLVVHITSGVQVASDRPIGIDHEERVRRRAA